MPITNIIINLGLGLVTVSLAYYHYLQIKGSRLHGKDYTHPINLETLSEVGINGAIYLIGCSAMNPTVMAILQTGSLLLLNPPEITRY